MHYLDSITMEQGIRRAIQSVQQQIDQALLSHPPVPFARGAARSVLSWVLRRRGRVGNAARNQGVTAFAIRLRSVAIRYPTFPFGKIAYRPPHPLFATDSSPPESSIAGARSVRLRHKVVFR